MFTARKPTDLEMDAHLARYMELHASNIVADNLDYSRVANHLDINSVAESIDFDYYEIAQNVSTSDIAYEINVCEIVDYIDTDDLANEVLGQIDLDDLADNIEIDTAKIVDRVSFDDIASHLSQELDYDALSRAIIHHVDTSRIVDGVTENFDMTSIVDIQEIVDRVLNAVGDAISGAV